MYSASNVQLWSEEMSMTHRERRFWLRLKNKLCPPVFWLILGLD